MKDQVIPEKVLANDIIETYNGKEIVFLVEVFLNDTIVIRFKSGKKIICYPKELLNVNRTTKSFSNTINHKRDFKI